jgi:hypothetical protein
MNKIFQEYSTSTAFMIQLSKVQCNALFSVETFKRGDVPFLFHNVGTLKCLESRGLVFWNRDEKGEANGFGGLTEAGKLMVALLKEAGLSEESTRTVGVIKKMGWAA